MQVYSISSATYNLILDLERTRLKKLFSCIIIYQTIDHILQETFLCVIPSYDYFLSTQNNLILQNNSEIFGRKKNLEIVRKNKFEKKKEARYARVIS